VGGVSAPPLEQQIEEHETRLAELRAMQKDMPPEDAVRLRATIKRYEKRLATLNVERAELGDPAPRRLEFTLYHPKLLLTGGQYEAWLNRSRADGTTLDEVLRVALLKLLARDLPEDEQA
jgi:hypothetical protein